MLTKADKKLILDAFKMIDVKRLEIDLPNPKLVKWFRFGSYNGLMMASEIIKQLPEKQVKPVDKKP
jgi:hypothetical protein